MVFQKLKVSFKDASSVEFFFSVPAGSILVLPLLERQRRRVFHGEGAMAAMMGSIETAMSPLLLMGEFI